MTTVNIGLNTGDVGSIQDDRLDSDFSELNLNNGANVNSFAGLDGAGRVMKDIERFDLSTITSGDNCDAATLNLYDTNWVNRTANCTMDIYEIAAANSGWVVGTSIDAAEVGAACWNRKTYNTVNWAGSAGLQTATTDYINTSLGNASFTDGVSGYRSITINASGLAVLKALFGSTGGAGWVLVGSGAGASWTQMASSQGTDGQRPYLAITYSVPSSSSPGSLVNGGLVNRGLVNAGLVN